MRALPLLLAAVLGCGTNGPGLGQCLPEETEECRCCNLQRGQRVCEANGGWGPCVCTGEPICRPSRLLSDQRDDTCDPQIHALYVLPSDGVDDGIDIDGTIATSLEATQNWFREQSGGLELRIDSCDKEFDVTFFRLARSDAAIASAGAFVRDELETELRAAGFDKPNKLYAVYYGGSSTFACGGGAWPPTLPGTMAALYLKGQVENAPPCASNAFASSAMDPAYWEFAMLHEVVHTLGLVAECAANHTLAGHASDSPTDLMYAGAAPWQPSALDVGTDDYFGHQVESCGDLKSSAFLEPMAADAVMPPLWPSP